MMVVAVALRTRGSRDVGHSSRLAPRMAGGGAFSFGRAALRLLPTPTPTSPLLLLLDVMVGARLHGVPRPVAMLVPVFPFEA